MAEEQNIEQLKPGEKGPLPPDKRLEFTRSPEKSPEQAVEKTAEKTAEKVTLPREGQAGTEITPPTSAPTASSSARLKAIEEILSDGLEEMYLSMELEKRQQFKQAGEEASRQINSLIEQGKATAQKIVSLIKEWLRLIPGVNKFFLEQEAKIKTDRILAESRKQ